jgi:type IV pilus assembly protein PilY1
MTNKKGWFIDLVSPINGVEGERMVVPNRFQGVALIGTTRIPEAENPCKPSGKGWVMAIDPFTGARLPQTFFDATLDGEFTEADMLPSNGESAPVSGLFMDNSPNNPIFVEDVMQVGLDDGTTKTVKTSGSAVQATRMSWRELVN